jgi:hypothetical protein
MPGRRVSAVFPGFLRREGRSALDLGSQPVDWPASLAWKN